MARNQTTRMRVKYWKILAVLSFALYCDQNLPQQRMFVMDSTISGGRYHTVVRRAPSWFGKPAARCLVLPKSQSFATCRAPSISTFAGFRSR